MGLGSVSRPVVARLPPACGDGDAGLEFFALAGASATPQSPKTGSPTRPFFPLGRIVGVAPCQRCIGRWRGGCATKPGCGGSPRIGSWNCAHLESNKVVLMDKHTLRFPLTLSLG